MLAHAIEDGDLAALDPADFFGGMEMGRGSACKPPREWGENGRLVARLYSRTGEDISASFPDLVGAAGLPGAIDGELLIVRDGRVQSFNVLQQRLNRKTVSDKLDQPSQRASAVTVCTSRVAAASVRSRRELGANRSGLPLLLNALTRSDDSSEVGSIWFTAREGLPIAGRGCLSKADGRYKRPRRGDRCQCWKPARAHDTTRANAADDGPAAAAGRRADLGAPIPSPSCSTASLTSPAATTSCG